MNPNCLPALQECVFYHSMDLPGIGSIEGDWDLRGKFDEYIGSIDVSGKTVLDVGTASGFLTFEAEKRGATVFSFDADGPERIQLVPPAEITEYNRSYFHGMRNSYRLAHHALKSKATPIYGDIYRMSEVVPRCDVVFVAQILVHLRDPLGGLQQASLAAKEHLIIVEGVDTAPATDIPSAHFLAVQIQYGWWHLSLPLYQALLPKLGFSITSVKTAEYTSHGSSVHKLTTIVARRV
jgi:hypothetical protein